MRNVLIEVRQLRREGISRRGLGVDGLAQLGSDSQLGMQGSLYAQDAQRQQSIAATQQVLVLNGRSAYIALRTSTPLRLMQSVYRHGVLHITQGTLMLEAGTGFMATPRWDGSAQVELELSAQQSARHTTPSGVGSSLLLPLGAWVTVAQTDQILSVERTDIGASASRTEHSGLEVQVRLTLR